MVAIEYVGHLVEKYFSTVEGVPTEQWIKIARMIETITGGTALVDFMHGAQAPPKPTG